MNDTGGGVTAIHDVPGDITRIGFHWMLFFPFSHSKGGFYLFFTRSVAEITGFSLSRIFEFANFFFFFSSHGESRRSRGFFVPNFFLVPNFRIFEFFFTRIVAE